MIMSVCCLQASNDIIRTDSTSHSNSNTAVYRSTGWHLGTSHYNTFCHTMLINIASVLALRVIVYVSDMSFAQSSTNAYA